MLQPFWFSHSLIFLFKITKEKTIKLALTHITDILCGLISDLQVIPEVFLEFIFILARSSLCAVKTPLSFGDALRI